MQFGLARAVDLDTKNRTECSAFLSAVREKYTQYTGILSIAPDGMLFCDSLKTNRNLDLNDREYFKKALVTHGRVTLQPVVGRLTGISVLQIAFPARTAAGELKFVLLASFNLQKFANFHYHRLSGAVDILLVDKNGAVLASPSGLGLNKATLTSIANTDLFQLAKNPAGRALEVTGIDGEKQYWAAVETPAIRDAGLYIMAGISKDALVAAANKSLYQDLAIVGLVSLLLFAGVWTLAEIGIRRQVGRIAAMAKKLSAGDLSVRIASPHPGGELGRVMAELNTAAESLQRQHAAIDELNQKLHDSQAVEASTKVFLDTVIENIPLPILVKAPRDSAQNVDDWQLTLVNRAYEKYTGLPRSELIGKSARDLYGDAADFIADADGQALDSAFGNHHARIFIADRREWRPDCDLEWNRHSRRQR